LFITLGSLSREDHTWNGSSTCELVSYDADFSLAGQIQVSSLPLLFIPSFAAAVNVLRS
jgi:hypothetical protein